MHGPYVTGQSDHGRIEVRLRRTDVQSEQRGSQLCERDHGALARVPEALRARTREYAVTAGVGVEEDSLRIAVGRVAGEPVVGADANYLAYRRDETIGARTSWAWRRRAEVSGRRLDMVAEWLAAQASRSEVRRTQSPLDPAVKRLRRQGRRDHIRDTIPLDLLLRAASTFHLSQTS